MDVQDTVLFGKYHLCRIIGKGRTGTVYLARHISLGEYRAIKEVSKTHIDYEQFRREALIMKELRHPAIPIVYDLEETETHCYLIEEFLEGESLTALALDRSNLTRSMVIQYGIQICRLVQYLHSAGREPILYLDLQPNNLLLCNGVIKLVDFGTADYLIRANETNRRCGTPGCAAPEQYTRGPLDERTDIYAIGVILFYLATGQLPESTGKVSFTDWDMTLGREFGTLIRNCLSSREQRPETALEVEKRLELLLDLEPWVFRKDSDTSLILSIAGSGPNVGVTHLALGLSACLWKWGIPNLYEECNPSGHGILLAEQACTEPDNSGVYRVGSWRLLPHYGPQVRLKEPGKYPVHIRDYGSDCRTAGREYEKASSHQKHLLYVCGGKAYDSAENNCSAEKLGQEKVTVIYNFLEPGYRPPCLGKGLEGRTMFMPYFPRASRPGKEAESFYRALWDRLTGGKGADRRNIFSQIKKVFRMKKKL
ncbi:MAG: serine/threonine protein kinase [Lachnospiraceae bacterium]|nr:serine/threonine protein kinase [Lachnospiraceae bacterium]